MQPKLFGKVTPRDFFLDRYSAVGGTVGQAENEMVIKVLSEALAVPRISVQHAALHAWASLIEAKADSIVLPTLGPALQFVLSTTTPEIRAQPRLRTAALGCAFLAIERLYCPLLFPRDFAHTLVALRRTGIRLSVKLKGLPQE